MRGIPFHWDIVPTNHVPLMAGEVMYHDTSEANLTLTHNNFIADLQDHEECDKCLEYRPCVAIVERNGEMYASHICIDCLKRLTQILEQANNRGVV